jgi:dipeptidase E
MGGNTFMLRYQMQRSGFDNVIKELLESNIVYGGDSAGALVAGTSIGGINLESSDEPEFAEKVIEDGLDLVPYIIVPHIDDAEFAEVMPVVNARPDQDKIIRLKNSQAVIFNKGDYKIVEAH